MIVAVAGGTGQVGRLVVQALRGAGHTPRVLARSAGVDLVSGSGLAGAMAGVTRVVDVSNMKTTSGRRARAFFEAATGNLVRVGAELGIEHQVCLSIVGVDQVGTGYYRAKLRQEQVLAAGRVPWTVLRATQFHEFAEQMVATPGPVIPGPVMRSQPVAAAEVAGALVDLVLAEPVGHAPELAGPEVLSMLDLVRRVARARHSRRPVVPLRIPGAAGTAMANGALLPSQPGPRGVLTFEEWLNPRPAPESSDSGAGRSDPDESDESDVSLTDAGVRAPGAADPNGSEAGPFEPGVSPADVSLTDAGAPE